MPHGTITTTFSLQVCDHIFLMNRNFLYDVCCLLPVGCWLLAIIDNRTSSRIRFIVDFVLRIRMSRLIQINSTDKRQSKALAIQFGRLILVNVIKFRRFSVWHVCMYVCIHECAFLCKQVCVNVLKCM